MKDSASLQTTANSEEKSEDQPVNKIVVFIIVALSLLMTTVDTTIVATALETLQRELDTSVNWVGWTMTAYSLGFVLMLPLSAKLSMRHGPRRVFLLSIAVFTLTSFFCGLAQNIEMLIVLRVIQAIGAAGITPSVTAIIVDHFGNSRDRAVSLFGSIFPIGVMIGPIFGGLIVTYWTWHWIFFVNVPIGILIIIMSFYFIPEDIKKKLTAHTKMDIKGVAWLALGILASMFAATYLGDKGSKALSFIFIGLVLVAAIGLIGFFKHIKLVKNPFIFPKFICGKGFGAVNFLNIFYGGTTQGVIALLPLYAAHRYGLNALDSGTLLIAQGSASVILSILTTIFLRRTGYKIPLYIGCSIILSGVALLAFQPLWGISPYYWLAIGAFLIGIGMGIISPPARNAGLQLAPEESATIAALRSLCLQLGSIISIAVFTAIIAGTELAGEAQASVYLVVAIVFLIFLPVISKVPEHKGSW